MTEPQPTPPLTLHQWKAKMAAVKTFAEWAALADACPPDDSDPDFDIVRAINETRYLTGFRVVDPAYRDEFERDANGCPISSR